MQSVGYQQSMVENWKIFKEEPRVESGIIDGENGQNESGEAACGKKEVNAK